MLSAVPGSRDAECQGALSIHLLALREEKRPDTELTAWDVPAESDRLSDPTVVLQVHGQGA